MGQEVIVANARKLKLISENNQKSDRVDAQLLSELGCTNVAWLHGVWVRSEAWHRDLLVVRARQALVEVRTGLINQTRGTAKSYGSRLQKCSAEKFADVAEEAPDALQPAIGGVLATLRALDEQIGEYDRQIEAMCAEKYPQTRWLRQVKGVGPVTALTYGGAPHVGFSRLSRRINSRTSFGTAGRPGLPWRIFQVQNRPKPLRCQWMTVAAWKIESRDCQPFQTAESHTQRKRSAGVSLGRLTERWRTAI